MSFTLALVADLAKKDHTGWLLSTKLDGYRASLSPDGKLRTRGGKMFPCTDGFRDSLPPLHGHTLDGELLLPGEMFENHTALLRKTGDRSVWGRVKYHVFDIMEDSERTYIERLRDLHEIVAAQGEDASLMLVDQIMVKNNAHVRAVADTVMASGGEGVMIRNPIMTYERKRTKNLVKIKARRDAEAILTGYTKGSGKNEDKIGSYKARLLTDPKVWFQVAGMRDDMRLLHNAPPIGTVFTFTCNDFTASGKPRHPRFLRVRD
jgi:DNA ligase-1